MLKCVGRIFSVLITLALTFCISFDSGAYDVLTGEDFGDITLDALDRELDWTNAEFETFDNLSESVHFLSIAFTHSGNSIYGFMYASYESSEELSLIIKTDISFGSNYGYIIFAPKSGDTFFSDGGGIRCDSFSSSEDGFFSAEFSFTLSKGVFNYGDNLKIGVGCACLDNIDYIEDFAHFDVYKTLDCYVGEKVVAPVKTTKPSTYKKTTKKTTTKNTATTAPAATSGTSVESVTEAQPTVFETYANSETAITVTVMCITALIAIIIIVTLGRKVFLYSRAERPINDKIRKYYEEFETDGLLDEDYEKAKIQRKKPSGKAKKPKSPKNPKSKNDDGNGSVESSAENMEEDE